ncbi:hypothetical protein A2926_00740 [Candidatus Giovannonibacteria bacterium RIFCSPLOWO2_01_FULL_44_40]|nr:MAG: hypothetical protein A3C77_02955 [Candidatus Giovannonibacteria bacterium RIFCSPHIGHO2_02_FULL_45_13]OGF79606.1 MAG: hypothetical protein A2926_00740 [Candidatus Giovannonibacteria bacterium RIFCSPLOWO2_01_FULL_44_40]
MKKTSPEGEPVMADKFTFGSAGEIQEVEFALARHGWTHSLLKKATGGDFFGLVREALEGRAEICRIERLAAVGDVVPAPEASPDFIIRVDRSVKPSYPDWMKKVMHPKLELTGPAEYNLNAVELWLHNDQKTGAVRGHTIYKHLQKDNALADCLGLADLLAIQAKGIAVFRKLYASKAVFGWKSVVRHRHGNLFVPCLCGRGDGVVLHWRWLDRGWGSDDPALRFGK